MHALSGRGLPGKSLIAGVIGLMFSLSTVHAADFALHTNLNIFGLDLTSGNPLDLSPPLASDQDEINLCQRNCDANPRCMAFTWVRRGAQGATAKCWFKASPRIFENHALGLLTEDHNTVTGVKFYSSRACWARHLANLKLCDVVVAGASGDPADVVSLVCPPGSNPASLSSPAIPGRFDRFCVVRRSTDPGGLPNCTDAFGGESHEAGVLGNRVNQACLDAN